MRSILVTGASGYIGRHVVTALARSGFRVICISRTVPDGDNNAMYIAADVLSDTFDLLDVVGELPDICLHMAWRNGFSHNDFSHLEDLPKHCRFLSRIADAGVGQIAVMGSMHEVGYWEGPVDAGTPCDPMSNYGIAKDALRKFALLLPNTHEGLIVQWLRGYYIFGDDLESQSIFGKLCRAAAEGVKTFPFTTGKNKYDFIHVDELAEQIVAVVSQSEVGGVINCCSGAPMTLADKIEQFIADNELDIALEYGKFPDRAYDSPGIWGDSTIIDGILSAVDGK